MEVDNSVLDQLGPPSNLPEMFLQQTAPEAQRIVLIPPKGMKNAAGGRSHKHHLGTPEAAPAPAPAEGEAVHLHPLKQHGGGKTGKAAKSAEPTPVVAKESAPALLTPTLAPTQTPVASEPLPPPASTTRNPVTQPVPAPTAPTAAAPTAAPAGGTAALTAQPTAPQASAAAATPEAPSTIKFDKESARLPDGARDLLAHLASRMSEDATLEVQLLAYAAGDEENASKARRLSLSRALAVRSFLIDQGVRSTRIEVRALGNKVPDGEPDRVDIEMQKRG